MSTDTIRDLIDLVMNDDMVGANKIFNDELNSRVDAATDEMKIGLAQGMYGDGEVEETEVDNEETFVDDQESDDLNVDDISLEDLDETELESLEDEEE